MAEVPYINRLSPATWLGNAFRGLGLQASPPAIAEDEAQTQALEQKMGMMPNYAYGGQESRYRPMPPAGIVPLPGQVKPPPSFAPYAGNEPQFGPQVPNVAPQVAQGPQEQPLVFSVRAPTRQAPQAPQAAPRAPVSPQVPSLAQIAPKTLQTAQTQTGLPQRPDHDWDKWMPPDVGAQFNAAHQRANAGQTPWGQGTPNATQMAQQAPNAQHANLSKPGDGVNAFVGNNGLQIFQPNQLTPNGFQGPVLDHANTGKHVGYLAGSPAAQAAQGQVAPGSAMASFLNFMGPQL